ncbi:hypothetical protein [Amaricoccus sp.]|nr:hypothetical protein [Amaricoccus sp.]HRO10240.1 hypothetical protein [Amaricoccus sp.]
MILDQLPGNALDPSAPGGGTTSRMGLDALHGIRAEAVLRAGVRGAG